MQIIVAIFSKLPSIDVRSLLLMLCCDISLTESHTEYLGAGRETSNLLVSSIQPRQIFVSSGAPSASFFLSEITFCRGNILSVDFRWN